MGPLGPPTTSLATLQKIVDFEEIKSKSYQCFKGRYTEGENEIPVATHVMFQEIHALVTNVETIALDK
jgi:hypothetical protein